MRVIQRRSYLVGIAGSGPLLVGGYLALVSPQRLHFRRYVLSRRMTAAGSQSKYTTVAEHEAPAEVCAMSVARYADAWNAVFVTPARFRELSSRLDELLDRAERPRDAVRRSTMIGTIFGRSEDELRTKLAARGWSVEDARGHGLVAGTPAMLVEQLRGYREAGVERVMLQWLDQDDIEGLEIIGHEVLVAL